MQSLFCDYILNNDEAILEHVVGHSTAEKHLRLSVYKNNVFHSLMTALGEIFPITRQLCGDDFFNGLAYEYVQTHTPTSPILHQYGEDFATTMTQLPSHTAYPYLADMANLEYNLLQTTHTADTPVLSPETLGHRLTKIENVAHSRWQLDPAIRIIESAFNLAELYDIHASHTPERLSTLNWQQPCCMLITKNDHHFAEIHPITRQEACLIKRLQQGHTLEQACCDIDENESLNLFSQFIHYPIIVGVMDGQETSLC